MRDLVETVIAQVMKHDPPTPARRHASTPIHGIHKFTAKMNDAVANRTHVQARPPQEHRDKRLWHASLQFEAMMFQQMMASMRKTIPSSGFVHTGFAEDVQGSMFDQVVAKDAAKQGGLGIANSIYRQLSHADTAQHSGTRTHIAQAIVESSDKQKQESMMLEKDHIRLGR